jgi:hypothetical protein
MKTVTRMFGRNKRPMSNKGYLLDLLNVHLRAIDSIYQARGGTLTSSGVLIAYLSPREHAGFQEGQKLEELGEFRNDYNISHERCVTLAVHVNHLNSDIYDK